MKLLRRALLILLILVVGGGVGYMARQDSGYVLIAWGDHAVEMSLWIGLAALIALVLLWLLARRLLMVLGKLRPNRQHQGVKSLENGIMAFLELKLPRAKRLLAKGERYSPLPWVNQLLLARIAQAEKDYANVAMWLDKATEENPHVELASGLLLALSAYESKQFELALAHCKRLTQKHPENPFVLRLLRDVYVRLHDWDALLELQPRLIRAGRKSVEPWQTDMINGLIATSPANAGARLQKWWKALSQQQQASADLRYQYLRALVALETPSVAKKALESALAQDWDTRLVVLYSDLNTTARERLQQAERWRTTHTPDARFYLALGRLCLQESLWGKARDYFNDGLVQETLPELYWELARLEEALGHRDSSHERLTALAAQVLQCPELPLPDANTKHE